MLNIGKNKMETKVRKGKVRAVDPKLSLDEFLFSCSTPLRYCDFHMLLLESFSARDDFEPRTETGSKHFACQDSVSPILPHQTSPRDTFNVIVRTHVKLENSSLTVAVRGSKTLGA